MFVPFESLPGESRIWIFPSQEPLDQSKITTLQQASRDFVNQWTSHDRSLQGSATWLEDRFLIISVDESNHGASGCSIDKLMRFIQQLENTLGSSLLWKHKIFIKQDHQLIAKTIPEIKELIQRKELELSDQYYDVLIDTKDKLRTEWKKDIGSGWLAKRVMN
jgi:hypothetical protein